MSDLSGDKAGVGFWQDRYLAGSAGSAGGWSPEYYEERILDEWLSRPLAAGARSLLEVGCGDSRWLPYLSSRWGVRTVAGVDYSPAGCKLVVDRLEAAGIEARIECTDIMSIDPERFGRFDMVFSLGLVEHFDDPAPVIRQLAACVAPDGSLVTVIPNLRFSTHWLATRIWAPRALATHRPIGRRGLHALHQQVGLHDVRTSYVGVFSLMIVPWVRPERFGRAAVPIVNVVDRVRDRLDPLLSRCGSTGTTLLAPYVISIGRKESAPGAV